MGYLPSCCVSIYKQTGRRNWDIYVVDGKSCCIYCMTNTQKSDSYYIIPSLLIHNTFRSRERDSGLLAPSTVIPPSPRSEEEKRMITLNGYIHLLQWLLCK